MDIQPLNNNILLKQRKKNTKNDAGFIIPQNSDKDTQIGDVVGVGPEASKDIKKGDTVVYANFSGAEIGGYLLIADTDLIGKIFDKGCDHVLVMLNNENAKQCQKCGKKFPILHY